MARTVRLDVLRQQIQYLADIQGMTARHATSDLNRAINQSIQHFREKVSQHGLRNYITHATGTLTSGATSPFAFTVLDLSAVSPAVVRVFGIEITIRGRIQPLELIDFENRNDFQDWTFGPISDEPTAWAPYQQARVAILPASNAAYPYTVFYLPVLPDLTNDSDTFDGVVGWEEWVAWDALIKVLQRDQYPQVYATATAERDRIWADIERNCNPAKSGGLVKRVDSRELRQDRMRRRSSWWWM